MPITIAISDDNHQRRQQLERRLGNQRELIVLSDAPSRCPSQERRLRSRVRMSTADNTIARSQRLQPRVLLTSVEQLSSSQGQLIQALQQHCPDTQVLMISPADSEPLLDAQLLNGLSQGARGWLASDSPEEQFVQAVRQVERGEAWVPRRLLGPLMARLRAISPVEALPA